MYSRIVCIVWDRSRTFDFICVTSLKLKTHKTAHAVVIIVCTIVF